MGKFLRKILLGLLILVFVLIAAAAIVPIFFKKQLVGVIKREANKNLNATVNFNNDIGLSVFKHFPYITVSIDSFTIAGKGDFQGDTLANISKLELSADIMSVIRGEQYEIKRIQLKQPRLHVRVLKDGRANYDISIPDSTVTTDTAASEYDIALKKFTIEDGEIIYDDASMAFYTRMNDLDMDLKGDMDEEQTLIQSVIEVAQLTVGYGGINYLSDVKTKIDADIDADMVNSKYSFKENKLSLNELNLGFDGWLAMPDTNIDMDLKFAVKETEFKNLLSLVPAVYSKDFAKVKTSGRMAFNGFAKGRYNASQLPAFDLNLDVQDARFQYPDLPSALEKILVKLKIHNPDGIYDHTVVDLSKFHMEMNRDPFDARALVKTLESDPYIDAFVKGKLDLASVGKLVPLDGAKLSGILNADVSAKGYVSALDKGQYENFDAKGNVLATAVNYSSKDLPLPFTLNKGLVNFTPQALNIPEFDALFGPTDFRLKAGISNFFAYLLRDQMLKGSAEIQSNVLDINSFLAEDPNASKKEPKPEDSLPMMAFEVPGNLDFAVKMNAAKVLYDNLDMRDFKSAVKIADQTLRIENSSFRIFNGTVAMSGLYESKDPKKPNTELNLRLSSLDIPAVVKYVNVVKQLAPIAEYARGLVNAELNFKTPMDQHMKPLLGALTANGTLNLPNLGLVGFKPLEVLGDQLKLPEGVGNVPGAEKLGAVRNYNFKALLVAFEIMDGKVIMKKGLNLPLRDKIKLAIEPEGYTTLDQKISYKGAVSVPRKDLGKANAVLEDALSRATKAGVKLNLDELIDVPVSFGGTVTRPDVKIDFTAVRDKMLGGLKDQLKGAIEEKKKEVIETVDKEAERLLNEAKEKGDKLIAEARKQGDALRAEAKKQSDAIIAEGDKQADKIMKEAGSNPLKKLAAEKAADKVRSESRKKADDVNKEADKKANDLLAKAQSESDKLIEDAHNKKNSAKPK